jgi:hypothetical protein
VAAALSLRCTLLVTIILEQRPFLLLGSLLTGLVLLGGDLLHVSLLLSGHLL